MSTSVPIDAHSDHSHQRQRSVGRTTLSRIIHERFCGNRHVRERGAGPEARGRPEEVFPFSPRALSPGFYANSQRTVMNNVG
jgi:hypothetical protein